MKLPRYHSLAALRRSGVWALSHAGVYSPFGCWRGETEWALQLAAEKMVQWYWQQKDSV